MHFDKASLRGVALAAGVAVMPLLLYGCFATHADLEPIKSDIAVMEKQFVELKRGQPAYSPGQSETAAPSGAAQVSPATDRRIADIEARLDRLESRLLSLGQTQPATMTPQPMAPEPVVVEPLETAPAPVPVSSAPSTGQVVVTQVQPQPAQIHATPATVDDIYKDAMAALKEGRLKDAEDGFGRVLQESPEDRLADNAAYWLGEVYYSRKEYDRAVTVFKKLVKDYPVGDKVPDAVLKMGMAYDELGSADNAREAYNRVIDNYPYSDAARLARQRMGNTN